VPSRRVGHQLCVAALNDDDLLRQYSTPRQQGSTQKAQLRAANQSGNALFLLIMANLAVFLFDHVLNQGWTKLLYLNHSAPRWWQFVTSAFSHGSWQHLSSNLFGLYVFGREVETDGGALGVTATYLVTALGASIASILVLPRNSMSLGASGAVFGMYAVSVLLKLSSGFSIKKIVEAGILGQFVFTQVQQEFVSQSRLIGSGAMIGASGVSHIAHLAGAAVGVLLIVLLSRIPGGDE
jgi:membrane associated rhomboid family serine protease